jgi:hypothetical protein
VGDEGHRINFFGSQLSGWLAEDMFVPFLACVQISHGNTARHALEHGDDVLAKICGTIASDEGRHEQAYQRVSCNPHAARVQQAHAATAQCTPVAVQ